MAGTWRALSNPLAAACLVATLLVAVVMPVAGAAAHASLDRAEPPAGSRLREAPRQLVLHFTQALKPEGSWAQLWAEGSQVPVQYSFDPASPRQLSVSLPLLEPAVYSVRWQTLSADDDDYAQGAYDLTVLNPDGSEPGVTSGVEAPASSGGGSAAPLMAAGVVIILLGGGFLLLRRRRAA